MFSLFIPRIESNNLSSIIQGPYHLFVFHKYLSKQTCLKLMYSTLSAKLDYCNSLLYGLPDSYIRLLQRAQNSAARLITQTKKMDHITPILRQLHWLPVIYRIQFKILLLTYKSLNGLAPSYLTELIHYNNPGRSLRSSNKVTLKVPRTRLKSYGDRSFSYCSPTLWNQLPADIRLAPNIGIFRSKLKTHLFKRAYLWWTIVKRQWASMMETRRYINWNWIELNWYLVWWCKGTACQREVEKWIFQI